MEDNGFWKEMGEIVVFAFGMVVLFFIILLFWNMNAIGKWLFN